METSYLSLDHLSYAYHGMHGETCALTDISFSVKKRRIYCDRGAKRLRQCAGFVSDTFVLWVSQINMCGLSIPNDLCYDLS